MNDVDLPAHIDDVVVVEGSVRVEHERLHLGLGAVVPQLGLVNKTTTVNEDQTADMSVGLQFLQFVKQMDVREDRDAVVLHLI